MTNVFAVLKNVTNKFDKKGYNIFTAIRGLVKNQIAAEHKTGKFVTEENCDSIKVRGRYPQGAITYLTSQGALKVANVTVEDDKDFGKAYIIKFKDINFDAPFFKSLKRSTVYVSGLMEYNDQERADNNRYMSNGNIVGYDAYYIDETRYEKLADEDSCTFELFVQWLKYKNYQDFIENNKRDSEEIHQLYEKFCQGAIASDWMIGEDDQIEDEIEIA